MNLKRKFYSKWNELKRNCIAQSMLALIVALWSTTVYSSSSSKDFSPSKLTMKVENESLNLVFKKIEKQLDVHFFYETSQVNSLQKISFVANNESLPNILDKICTPLNLKFEIIDKNIIVTKASVQKKGTKNNLTISGKVVSKEDGLPIPGVIVKLKGTNLATTTTFDGSFTIATSNDNGVLIFNYLGYTTQEIEINSSVTNLNVILIQDAKQLQEVVVMGYGSVKKSQVVGAVSSVSLKEISSRTYNSTAELLQGTAAGVTVINNGGDPTAPPTINIRGIGSLNAESPLLILDGIIYSGSINTINPNDIESISVLKDAASAAIYGARASGGVILITTKKGNAERLNINVNFQSGIQSVAKKLVALNAAEYSDAMNTATDNAGLPRIPAFNIANEPSARTTNTVWMDEIFRVGQVSDLTASIDGGSEKMNFFVSGGYRKNEGILLNTFSERYTARINATFKITPKVTIGENFNYSLTNGQSANTDSGYTGAILSAIFYPPNATIYKQDGSGEFGGVPTKYVGSYGDVINPVAYLKRLDNRNPVSNMLINPFLNWEIIKGLSFKSNWGITRIQNDSKIFETKITEPGKIFDFNRLTQSSTTFTDLLSEQTLTFNKSMNKHNFSALLGYTYQSSEQEYFRVEGTGFDSEAPSQRYLLNAKTIEQKGAGNDKVMVLSYLGRLNYSYNDKYLFTGIIRRDGTSKLTKANRWEVYPSVSLGWVLTKENFMESSKTIVSNLKLRASWGQLGNLGSLGPYQFSVPLTQTTSLFGASPTLNFGFSEKELSNPELKWESSEQKNIGLDFGFFKNSFTGSIDVFEKTNKDMLVRDQLPGVAGTPSGRIVNSGDVQNRGLELSLGYKKTNGAFKFDITANAAFLKNEIVSIKDGLTNLEPLNAPRVRNLPLANIYQVGSSIGAFYGFSTQGLFQSDAAAKAYVNSNGVAYQPNAKAGDIRFKDLNGDGTINNNDRTILGNSFPSTTYSLNLNMNYKRFDFNVFFQGVGHVSVFNAVKYTGLNGSFPGYNLLAETKNAWSPQNTNTNIPILSAKDNNNNFGRISDFYIEDASFLRLRNVSFGYTLNENWVQHKLKARIFVSAQNLFTITKYSGMDPEVGINNFGTDLGRYPLSRIFITGINLTF
jgi:TonB-linked SusC/RagA family outer membrane protein